MSNELLLTASLFLTYSLVIVSLKLLKEEGMYIWTAIATITANIEVLVVIKAFGIEMSLGNILFASTFLVTDILSEVYGKKASQKAVRAGFLTSLFFVIISSAWMLYTPAESDWAMPSIRTLFSITPRLMAASMIVYIIVQYFDVWAYHKWWKLTTKMCGDKEKFLWLRNNGSTLLSQLLNAFLFNFGAFYGIYDNKTILSIAVSSYIIFIVTSLLDTPFVYLARYICRKDRKKSESEKATAQK